MQPHSVTPNHLIGEGDCASCFRYRLGREYPIPGSTTVLRLTEHHDILGLPFWRLHFAGQGEIDYVNHWTAEAAMAGWLEAAC